MLPDDFMASIERLPLDEKIFLLKTLTRTIAEELHRQSRGATIAPDARRAREMLDTDGPLPPFEELQGVLATETPLPSTYDWKEDYTDYLTKKYA